MPLDWELSGLLASLAELGGTLLLLPLLLPVLGLLSILALGGRYAGRVVLALSPLGLAAAAAVTAAISESGGPLHYHLGGWAPPLGVALTADGLSAVLLLTSSVVMSTVGVYAQRTFCAPKALPETRKSLAFWLLFLGVWGGLNLVFIGQDLFTLFVALELLTFSAVPLVSLDGRAETIAAALRYLLFALLGSALYLLGAVLFYGTYGTLDIPLLAGRIAGETLLPAAVIAAAALMTVGLLAKTALFPLHLWLPPAHAGAPAAASAILSALVVKASFFLVVRIWFDLMPVLLTRMGAQLLGALGAAAILYGGLLALRQPRLKMLVAYSTLAQLGYLFLIFPLAISPEGARFASLAAAPGVLTGGMLQLVSHAFAKAAMFMAAGLIAASLGQDQIRGLAGIGRALPMTVLAFGIGGLALTGLLPSGAYLAKTLLVGAAAENGQWWWTLAMQVGGLLTAAYLIRVFYHALSGFSESPTLNSRPALYQELAVLGLALCSILLGLLPPTLLGLAELGRLDSVSNAMQ
jgi:formate hydrogenlyase subunit 3/multisubunit Na+/H+ antiporter MnhD subunit